MTKPRDRDRMTLKLDILDSVLNAASVRAAAESDSGEMRTVTVSDVARSALWRAARTSEGGDDTARAIGLRSKQDGDRRRFKLIVPRPQYEEARRILRERGLSVAFVVEQGLMDYVQGIPPALTAETAPTQTEQDVTP